MRCVVSFCDNRKRVNELQSCLPEGPLMYCTHSYFQSITLTNLFQSEVGAYPEVVLNFTQKRLFDFFSVFRGFECCSGHLLTFLTCRSIVIQNETLLSHCKQPMPCVPCNNKLTTFQNSRDDRSPLLPHLRKSRTGHVCPDICQFWYTTALYIRPVKCTPKSE